LALKLGESEAKFECVSSIHQPPLRQREAKLSILQDL
jgi:hypothetical protein